MNIFRLVASIIYFIMGIVLIIISKFLPDKYYLKMRRGYKISNNSKIVKLGRLLSILSGTCWLIISYLFYNNMDIIIVLWINIAIIAIYKTTSCNYIEKSS